MILSHRHRFIFIKGKKVAGTSIEIALSSICGKDDIVTPITPIDELLRITRGTFCQNFGVDDCDLSNYILSLQQGNVECPIIKGKYFNHMSFENVLNCSMADFSDYLYIVAERNPYSKVASGAVFQRFFAQYKKDASLSGDHETYVDAVNSFFTKKLYMSAYNFDLYSMHIREPDFIIRYESLENDFSSLLKRLGVSSDVELPHVKKSVCFTPEQACELLGKKNVGIVTREFQKEFDYFGYQRCCDLT